MVIDVSKLIAGEIAGEIAALSWECHVAFLQWQRGEQSDQAFRLLVQRREALLDEFKLWYGRPYHNYYYSEDVHQYYS